MKTPTNKKTDLLQHLQPTQQNRPSTSQPTVSDSTGVGILESSFNTGCMKNSSLTIE